MDWKTPVVRLTERGFLAENAAIQRVPVSLLARTSSPWGEAAMACVLWVAGGAFQFAQIKVSPGHFGRFV